jgi:outer membrane receptor protein involved in Fe transport
MQSDTHNDNQGDGLRHTLVPAGQDDQVSRQEGASGYHERALEIDDTQPLGAHGKFEAGYHGSDRRTTNSSELRFFDGDSLVATPLSGTSDYSHREVLHSGYVTLGSTFGRLSLQVGARTEAAFTTFDVRSTGQQYVTDYRSLFPSANATWDFGKGRTVRLTYSKRIERPSASYLNPDVPSTDSLNRFVGNPHLEPKYTHSYSLDGSWTGARGSLRLSPYYRETVDNWDRVTQVNSTGVATTTWMNASSVRFFGTSLTASLRQTQRLGGTISVSVYRERHDASNLSGQYRQEATNWSANGNVVLKTTNALDLQGYLRYSPAQTLAQGSVSSYTYSNLGLRLKIGQSVWASLWISNPFNVARYVSATGDAAYAQSSTTQWGSRWFSLTLTWTWGKPPEQKPRRQGSDQPQQDAPIPKQ